MAQGRHITPEKQLLNLIETGAAGPAKAAGSAANVARRRSFSIFSPEAWLGRVAFLRDSARKTFARGKLQLDIKFLNTVIMIVVACLAMYFIVSLYFSVISLMKPPTVKLSAQAAREEKAALSSVSVLKNDASYYARKVRQRDIFKIDIPFGIAPREEKVAPRAEVPRVIEEIKRFKLVGISWSRDPDAMIEDTVALRTFFVKKGNMIGGVKVEDILKDKVILSFQGEEAEIK